MHAGEVRFKTLEEYRDQMRLITRSGQVDIMLMSASSNHALTFRERLFDNSPVTPAVRANDTTDIHLAQGASYALEPSRPFRTASIDHIQCGHLECAPDERTMGANLGLYSVTFNNNLDRDLATLERFHDFREEAERKGFRYFLEVFDPNMPGAVAPETLPRYINDMITRMLAGVGPPGRPVFLKMVYHGPKAMEELVRFDPHLVVGILGGSAGTTRDAFQLLHDAQKYGAKVALFGRKINNAENQLAFVHFLRLIVEGQVGPVDAVKAYHAVLGRLGLRPHRKLEEDLQLTDQAMNYAGTAGSSAVGTHARCPRRPSRGLKQRPRPLSVPRSGGRPEGSRRRLRLQRRLGCHRVVHGGFPIQPRRLERCLRIRQRPPRLHQDEPARATGLPSSTSRAGALGPMWFNLSFRPIVKSLNRLDLCDCGTSVPGLAPGGAFWRFLALLGGNPSPIPNRFNEL